jgi:hypothetical protein
VPDAAYYRAWRAAHPEYQKRQNELRNQRRRVAGREDRTAEYTARVSRAVELPPIPPLWVAGQHPLIDLAWGYVRHCPRGAVVSFLEDELSVDAIGVAVLAMLEHRDPKQAVDAFYAVENNWIVRAAPLLLAGEWDDSDP